MGYRGLGQKGNGRNGNGKKGNGKGEPKCIRKKRKRKKGNPIRKDQCLYNDVCITMFVCIVGLRVDQVQCMYCLGLWHLSTVSTRATLCVSAVFAVERWLSVCLSIYLTHAGIVSKRLNLYFFNLLVAPSIILVFRPLVPIPNSKGNPSMRA